MGALPPNDKYPRLLQCRRIGLSVSWRQPPGGKFLTVLHFWRLVAGDEVPRYIEELETQFRDISKKILKQAEQLVKK